jgi:hypothetical protein
LALFGLSPILVLVISGVLSAATLTTKNRLLSFALLGFPKNSRSAAAPSLQKTLASLIAVVVVGGGVGAGSQWGWRVCSYPF